MPRTTIDDVARRAGVSKGAASFALNGRAGVSSETRARVLRVAEELNWRPHSAARALGVSRAGVVGLVIARPARTIGVEPFFAQIISGLQAALSGDEIGLQLLVVENTDAEIAVYRRWHSEHRVDGIALMDLKLRDPRIELLEELELPCVVLGGPGGHGRLSSVWADDRAAMVSIVEHLADLGHRRVAHVAGMPNLRHTQRRIRALRDSARRLGLEQPVSVPTDFSDAEGAAATRQLLARAPRPSAIIYDNDVMAVAGLSAAAEQGLRVPEELSVVAFDDSVLARLTHPSLTALTRDTFALGEQVGTELLRVIAEPRKPRNVESATPSLVVRESTSKAPPVRSRAARPR
jgi:DNA-binding LacI/PurR family transcriptional regulator